MSLTNSVKDYHFVQGRVVKVTKKKPLTYFQNTALITELDSEHAKNETILSRKLASGLISMLDPKMTKKINSSFGRKELMERLVSMVNLGELEGYGKSMWGIFLLQWYCEPNNLIGFDLVHGTGTAENVPTGHVQLVFNPSINGNPRFMLLCESTASVTTDVISPTPVKVTLTYAHLNFDDPISITPNLRLSNPMMLEVDNDGLGFIIETGQDEVGLPIGEPDSYTYLIARVECLKPNAKGELKSLEKGKFDTLQIVGIRL